MTTPSPSLEHQKPVVRNPISLRLYKVLGANYDDQATRDALSTLSGFYDRPVLNGAARSNLNDESSSAANLPSEHSISDKNVDAGRRSGDIAARARKNLRRDLENRLAEGSEKFLKAFEAVDKVCLWDHFPAFRSEIS